MDIMLKNMTKNKLKKNRLYSNQKKSFMKIVLIVKGSSLKDDYKFI